ncbi:hypothetical protein HMPREF9104_01954 [Lentilactobacillus kisonensis F0435]|uniref:Uncharacterized protein n=1 Tax=Lentilactobacillus kisonensis F0435 TaxID=797516 RepID=H1LH64_9LACO|nr:hypothetical protein HMPREF9104_01954 [Lentilactobacillus kisonensis F0435]
MINGIQDCVCQILSISESRHLPLSYPDLDKAEKQKLEQALEELKNN